MTGGGRTRPVHVSHAIPHFSTTPSQSSSIALPQISGVLGLIALLASLQSTSADQPSPSASSSPSTSAVVGAVGITTGLGLGARPEQNPTTSTRRTSATIVAMAYPRKTRRQPAPTTPSPLF